ncbi:hypothetical protein [Infirmifilum sp. SLHALR2]
MEFEVLKRLPLCRDYTDVARSAGVSLPTVPRVLESIKSKFLLRAFFDFSAMGFALGLFKLRFTEELVQKPIPFVVEKIPVLQGKGEQSLYILALCPAGRCSEVADILRSDESQVLTGRFLWRSDTMEEASLDKGYLRVSFSSVKKAIEEEIMPRMGAPVRREPDHVDLWIIAELMRDPFVKLSRESARAGLKQQTASYHYTQHVRPLHLYNALTPRFYQLNIPGVLLELDVAKDAAEQVAWGLSRHPMIREALASDSGKVYVLSYMQGGDLNELYRFLEDSNIVEDFTLIGVLTHRILEYTTPFGNALKENPYNLEIMYEAVYTPKRRALEWSVYEIGEGERQRS